MEPETMPVDLFWSNQRGILVTLYELHKKSQSNHCTKRKSFNSSNVQCNLPAGRCLQQQDLFHRGEEANTISTATRKYATMCMLAWFFIAQKFDGSRFNTRSSPIISSKYVVHNVRHVKITPGSKTKNHNTSTSNRKASRPDFVPEPHHLGPRGKSFSQTLSLWHSTDHQDTLAAGARDCMRIRNSLYISYSAKSTGKSMQDAHYYKTRLFNIQRHP